MTMSMAEMRNLKVAIAHLNTEQGYLLKAIDAMEAAAEHVVESGNYEAIHNLASIDKSIYIVPHKLEERAIELEQEIEHLKDLLARETE